MATCLVRSAFSLHVQTVSPPKERFQQPKHSKLQNVTPLTKVSCWLRPLLLYSLWIYHFFVKCVLVPSLISIVGLLFYAAVKTDRVFLKVRKSLDSMTNLRTVVPLCKYEFFNTPHLLLETQVRQ